MPPLTNPVLYHRERGPIDGDIIYNNFGLAQAKEVVGLISGFSAASRLALVKRARLRVGHPQPCNTATSLYSQTRRGLD